MNSKSFSPQSKLPGVGTSIFSVMSALARKHDAINLSQGFPDFDPDPGLRKLVADAMNSGGNQYAPSYGIPSLREGISSLAETFYSAKYDPETEITVTSGATEGLFCALAAVVREGDEVIVFEPAYDSYVPVIKLFGGIPVFISLNYPDYQVDWEAVKKRVTSKTRVIMINSPHNPSGAALTAQDMENLVKIVRNNNIFIISDEVYENIIFDGLEHQSAARFPRLAERSFIISSFGKNYHATGWKVGYCLAPADLTAEFRKIHQFNTFSTATPFQLAFSEYIKDLSRLRDLAAIYQEKRDFFRRQILGSRFKTLACSGTYFQLLGYDRITTEADTEFAKQMTIGNKLASVPVSVFYHQGEDHKVLRFCFAKAKETLEKAGEILQKL